MKKPVSPLRKQAFFVYKPEKGKQLERVGRKATGLHPQDKAAGLPGRYTAPCMFYISHGKNMEVLMLSCLALSKHSKSISSQFRIFLLTLLALSLVLFLSAGKAYSGQATLSWDPPTTNADGTPLTDLEGYKVYYGTLSGNYSQNIDAGNVTTYTANLSDGTYYFAVTAYDTSRNESDYSNEVNKTIRSIQQYTLTVNKNGTGAGTVTSPGINCGSDCTEPYDQGTIVTLTATAATGSAFTGWSGGGCTGAGTCSTTINANTTVTANFNKNTYAITATAGTGGNISPSGTVTVNQGDNKTFTITPNAGCHIADVMVDGSSVGAVSAYTFSNITANHSIGATFALNTYTITATAGAGGTITPSGAVTVNQGDSKTFTITPNAGYHIADVTVDGASAGAVSAYTFSNITANHSIGATFAVNTYTITAAAGAGGTITPSGTVTVNQGDSKTYTINPNTGYHIADVTVDGSSAGALSAYTFSNVTANHSIGAAFAVDASAQEIIIDNGDPGTSYTGAWYVSSGIDPYGTDSLWSRKGTYTWTFTPQQAGVYELSMWWTYLGSRSANIPVDIKYSDGTTRVYINQQQNGGRWNSLGTYPFATSTSYKVTITAQGSLTACADAVKFVHVSGGNIPPVAYTITATAGNGGSISPSGTVTVNQGENQTFTITPNTGYHIEDVMVDGASAGALSAYTFSNITANHSIGATFAINTYTITATAGSGGSISPSGTVTVNQGASQTFTITPNTGYHMADVIVDGASVGAASTYTFNNVTANHSIGATFALDASAQEIIIDNGDPGTSYTGAWYVSGGTGPYDTDSLWSRNGTYTWTFTPQQTGVYELSMWWTYFSSRSTNIPVDIEYSEGTTRVYINQQQNGSMWNSLGTYPFEAGTSYKVTITAGGSLTTCADAVKFVQKLYNY